MAGYIASLCPTKHVTGPTDSRYPTDIIAIGGEFVASVFTSEQSPGYVEIIDSRTGQPRGAQLPLPPGDDKLMVGDSSALWLLVEEGAKNQLVKLPFPSP
jgi:hypothetical protein